jgi:hypothetical protein
LVLLTKVIILCLLLCGSVLADVAVGTWSTIAVVGSANTLSSYTADAGSNRILLLAVSYEDNTAGALLDSMLYGSQKATAGPIVYHFDDAGARHGIDIHYILEADILGGSNDMVIYWSEPPQDGERVLSIVTLTGVDQTTPITDSDSASLGTGNATITNSVTGASGEMTIHYELHERGGAGQHWVQNNGAAEGYDLPSDGASSHHGLGYKLNHSTPSATHDLATDRPLGMSTVVIGKAANGEPPAATVGNYIHGPLKSQIHGADGASVLSGP